GNTAGLAAPCRAIEPPGFRCLGLRRRLSPPAGPGGAGAHRRSRASAPLCCSGRPGIAGAGTPGVRPPGRRIAGPALHGQLGGLVRPLARTVTPRGALAALRAAAVRRQRTARRHGCATGAAPRDEPAGAADRDRKSTRLNSSHVKKSYAVLCLKKKIFL